MEKLVEMTAGAGAHPPDALVDATWLSLAREAASRPEVEARPPAWSPRAILEENEEAEEALAAVGLEDAEAAAHSLELRSRRRALEAALAAGLPAAGPPAEGPRLEAFATHLTNDDYILGAEVLAASLAATGTARPLLALITAGVSEDGRRALQRAGWLLVDVDLVGVEGDDSPQARGFFSKIWLWALPAHRVVYIDTDVIAVRSLDELFELPDGAALSAVPDSQPHMDGEMIAQTGLMVIEPSRERFDDLWALCSGERRAKSLDEWKQLEQGFFTIYFDDGEELAPVGGGCGLGWRELPSRFNFCVRYALRPLYRGLTPTTTSMVHYACAKPWDLAQNNYAPPAYSLLYLQFAKAAGIRWRAVDCSADRAREREQKAKMEKIMREREQEEQR